MQLYILILADLDFENDILFLRDISLNRIMLSFHDFKPLLFYVWSACSCLLLVAFNWVVEFLKLISNPSIVRKLIPFLLLALHIFSACFFIKQDTGLCVGGGCLFVCLTYWGWVHISCLKEGVFMRNGRWLSSIALSIPMKKWPSVEMVNDSVAFLKLLLSLRMML